jgi:hypothetical protein
VIRSNQDIVAMPKNIMVLRIREVFDDIHIDNRTDLDRGVFGKVYGSCQETNSGIMLITRVVNSIIKFSIHGIVMMMIMTTPMILGIKLSVISLIWVVAWKILTASPKNIPTNKPGRER